MNLYCCNWQHFSNNFMQLEWMLYASCILFFLNLIQMKHKQNSFVKNSPQTSKIKILIEFIDVRRISQAVFFLQLWCVPPRATPHERKLFTLPATTTKKSNHICQPGRLLLPDSIIDLRAWMQAAEVTTEQQQNPLDCGAAVSGWLLVKRLWKL